MKIPPIGKTFPKPIKNVKISEAKKVVTKLDTSTEELGFFKVGDRIVPIRFPR